MFEQLVTPNPDIPCQPGWCLQYVRQTFGAPVVEPTATAGWFNADHRHTDWDFPEGVWVPVWFELDTEPAGHVALLAPDGSVYSTTHPTSTRPTHHPTLGHLFDAYAPYNPLTYRGWSEDISNVRVVQPATLSTQSTTIQEETLAKLDPDDLRNIHDAVWFGRDGARLIPNEMTGQGEWAYTTLGSMTARISRDVVAPGLAALRAGNVDAGTIAKSIVDQLGEGLAADVVSEVGKQLVAAGAKLSN